MARRVVLPFAGLLLGGTSYWLIEHARSPVVRAWRPGRGEHRRAGDLSVRTWGKGEHVFVLLHGITGSGEVFGAGWDRLGEHGGVVVPDLLGFGRSMDESRTDFSLEAHLAALDGMLVALELEGVPLTIAGHSLGGLLALHWGARRGATGVVAFCPPLYLGAEEADERIKGMGKLEKLFALENPLASAMCAWMCGHRRMASWLIPAVEPRWPVPVARMGVQHTWPSYLGAMNEVIRAGGWEGPIRELDRRDVPIALVDGARDQVPVPDRSAQLGRTYDQVGDVMHPTAGHDLPIEEPEWAAHFVLAEG
jgi:pimeloyl-ACP methyl ester carboxylesterase